MLLETLVDILIVGRIRHAPLQAVVVLFVLALTAFSAFLFGRVDEAIDASILHVVQRVSADVNLQILPGNGTITEDVLAQVRRLPGCTDAQPILDGSATIESPPTLAGHPLKIEGLDFFTGGFANQPRFREKILPSLYASRGENVPLEAMLQPNATIVSESFLRDLGLHVGESIGISASGFSTRLRIVATYPANAGFLDPAVALVDIPSAQHLFRMPNRLDRIDIAVAPELLRSTAGELKRRLPAGLNVVIVSDRLADLNHVVNGLKIAVGMLLVVLVILAGVVVLTTAGASVIERDRDVNILRDLGIDDAVVCRTFLIEGLIYGITGGVMGIAASAPILAAISGRSMTVSATALAGALLIPIILGTFSMIAPALRRNSRLMRRPTTARRLFANPPMIVAASVFIGVGVAFAAHKTDASVAAMFLSLGALLLTAPLIRGAGALLFRSSPGRPSIWLAAVFSSEPSARSILVLSALVISVALLAGLSIVESNERRSAVFAADASFPGSVIVRDRNGELRGPMSPAARAAKRGMRSVVVRRSQIVIDNRLITVLGIPNGEFPTLFHVPSLRAADGDAYETSTVAELTTQYGIRLAGLIPGFLDSADVIALSATGFAKRFPHGREVDTVVFSPSSAATKVILAELSTSGGAGVSIERTEDDRAEALAPVSELFELLRLAVTGIFFIACIGIASGSVVHVLDRRDQIATLRSVGASVSLIAQMIAIETVVTALLGCTIGVCLAAVLASVVLQALSSTVSLTWPLGQIGLTAFLALCALVAGALPAGIIASRFRSEHVA